MPKLVRAIGIGGSDIEVLFVEVAREGADVKCPRAARGAPVAKAMSNGYVVWGAVIVFHQCCDVMDRLHDYGGLSRSAWYCCSGAGSVSAYSGQ